MKARELYGRFRRQIAGLVDNCEADSDWPSQAVALARQLETEMQALNPESAGRLRDELCEQLEHDALHAVSVLRRDVLLAAVKQLDFTSPA